MKLIALFLSFLISQFSYAKDYPYRDEPKSDCAVSSHLADRYHFPVYKGACADDLANGQGVLKLYGNSDTADKPSTTLTGRFQSGIFMGPVTFKKPLLIDGKELKTKLGTLDGNEVWLHTKIWENKAIQFCSSVGGPYPKVYIGVKDITPYAKEKKAKSLFQRMYKMHRQYCKHSDYKNNLSLGIYEGNEKAKNYKQGSIIPSIYADMNHTKKNLFVRYQNTETYYLKKKNQELAQQNAIKKTTKKIHAILEKNHTVEVVTAEKLSKNPFKWEGKVVAIISKLVIMSTRDSAQITDVIPPNYTSKNIHVKSVKPSYFQKESILLIAKVIGKEKIDGQSLSVIEYIDHHVCGTENCDELYKAKIDIYKK